MGEHGSNGEVEARERGGHREGVHTADRLSVEDDPGGN